MSIIRTICRGFARYPNRVKMDIPKEHREKRALKVAIIGMPNAGKSTLINLFFDAEICPVSKRVHTTRESQLAVFLQDDTQLIFVDTPGVVNKKETKKFKFSDEFVNGPGTAIKSADIVGVIHDVSNKILRHKLDPRVINILKEYPEKNTILILNKVDMLKFKRSLLDSVRYLTNGTIGGKPINVDFKNPRKVLTAGDIMERAKQRRNLAENPEPSVVKNDSSTSENSRLSVGQEVNGWSGFQDVFMISALTGDGLDVLKDYFVANAKQWDWEFNEKILTNCSPMDLGLKILKAKLLEFLPDEIPYTVKTSIDFWEETEKDGLHILFGIKSPNERFTKIVIGLGGRTISQIETTVEQSLTKIFQKVIDLHIKVTTVEKEKK